MTPGVPGLGFVRSVAVAAVTWPAYALVGAVVALRRILSVLRGLPRARWVLRDTLRCPAGHDNTVYGRWSCDECGAEYMGWVGRCGVCGDGSADWFPCARCALAVRLPWRPA